MGANQPSWIISILNFQAFIYISLDTSALKDTRNAAHGQGLEEGPVQYVVKTVNYMWPAQLSEKEKKNSTRKTASALPLPSLTASCFQLFSPAGQVLSGWTLTRGEANKDSQNEQSSCFSTFFLLLGTWTPSAHIAPDLSFPMIPQAAGSFCELWTTPLTQPVITMSSFILLIKPLSLISITSQSSWS